MRVISLFGRGNIGKTRCLGHLINLIHRETKGCNYLFEGHDARITLDYLGQRISICTWGDNKHEEQLNIDKIQQDNPDIAVVATRTKGDTVELVERFCKERNCPLKWVEKYVASFDDKSGQEYMNTLQAEQMLDYIRGLITGQLYYVDSITSITSEGESNLFHVALLGAEMQDNKFPRTLSLELSDDDMYLQGLERRVEEDDFVLYRPDFEVTLRNGNEQPLAIALRNESRDLRGELSFRTVQGDSAWAIFNRDPDEVRSYHVNVGHGNCSLVLAVFGKKYELWVVDCSTYDYLMRCDYSQDLYHCLKDIAGLLNIDMMKLRVSRFMLTHTHFDHYCGLGYLIRQGFVDGQTVVYANLHYDCASPLWCGILKDLVALGCGIVEPTSQIVSKGAIRVYHPECRLYKYSSLVNTGERYEPKVNDSSVVYGISLAGHLMVFPGDLEQRGFEAMSKNGTCSSYLFNADYYVVSHHGSVNGHPTMACGSHMWDGATPLACAANNLKKAILTGRDKAYSGIYSKVVTDYWDGLGCLEYTEKAKWYIEVNWMSGEVEYF